MEGEERAGDWREERLNRGRLGDRLGALKPGAGAQWGLCLSRTLVPDPPSLLSQGLVQVSLESER